MDAGQFVQYAGDGGGHRSVGVDDGAGSVAAVDPEVQLQFRGRPQTSGHHLAVEVDHGHLVRGEFGEDRSGRGDRDPVLDAYAHVAGRADEEAFGPQAPQTSATAARSCLSAELEAVMGAKVA